MPQLPEAFRRRLVSASMRFAPCALSQLINARPLIGRSRPVIFGGGGSFRRPLVLQIDTDIVFIMPLKIVHGPAEHDIRGRVNISRLVQESAPPSQNIEVRRAMCRVPARHVRFMPVFQKHQTHDKGDDAASDHDKFHRDVSSIAQPYPVIF